MGRLATDVRRAKLAAYDTFGVLECAPLQNNFGVLSLDKALASLRLFASEFMQAPH